MPYLLDTQVVSFFLQARREADLAAAAAVMPCAIADEVRGELAEDPTRGRLFEQWLPSSHVEVIAIPVGGPADAILTRLQTGLVTRRGRGERASIALAATPQTSCLRAWTVAGCGSHFASCGSPENGSSHCRSFFGDWSTRRRLPAKPPTM